MATMPQERTSLRRSLSVWQAVGISVANAILLVTFAEQARRDGKSAVDAAIEGGHGRLRAILMTATSFLRLR